MCLSVMFHYIIINLVFLLFILHELLKMTVLDF